METESVNWSRVADTLESLRQELTRLGERVAALEKVAGPAVAPAPAAEGLSEEIVLVLGAAVAAFLGKKAPIRQIRLLGSTAWAQQGRVTIQASHTLEAHTGRR
jgi:methylmalonyl-CoA carboxyltransferase large subunit